MSLSCVSNRLLWGEEEGDLNFRRRYDSKMVYTVLSLSPRWLLGHSSNSTVPYDFRYFLSLAAAWFLMVKDQWTGRWKMPRRFILLNSFTPRCQKIWIIACTYRVLQTLSYIILHRENDCQSPKSILLAIREWFCWERTQVVNRGLVLWESDLRETESLPVMSPTLSFSSRLIKSETHWGLIENDSGGLRWLTYFEKAENVVYS